MKIISGKYKGRNLSGFSMEGTRPTMDRVKESLFATIQNYLPGSIVLDLFSGSGNLGIEAVSEGAKEAYLVDSSHQAIQTIKKNIKTLDIQNIKVVQCDYKQALQKFYEDQIKYDLIFLDPPYKTNYIEKSIELIEQYELLKEDGLIICESNQLDKIVYSEHFKVKKEKKYGDKYIVLLEKV